MRRSSFLGAAPGLPAAVAQNAASASLVLRHRQFAPDGSDKGHSKIQAEKTTEQMLEDVVPAQGCPLSEVPAVGKITQQRSQAMKRTIALVVTFAAVGFAAGAATGPRLKFPWASAADNALCGRTVLECRCLERQVVPAERLSSGWIITSAHAHPNRRGMSIQVRMIPRGVVARSEAKARLQEGIKEVAQQMRGRFYPFKLDAANIVGKTNPLDPKLWIDCRMEVFVGGKSAYTIGPSFN